MAIDRPEATGAAPARGPEHRGGRRTSGFLGSRGMAARPGEESRSDAVAARPVEALAVLRSDQAISRGRLEWAWGLPGEPRLATGSKGNGQPAPEQSWPAFGPAAEPVSNQAPTVHFNWASNRWSNARLAPVPRAAPTGSAADQRSTPHSFNPPDGGRVVDRSRCAPTVRAAPCAFPAPHLVRRVGRQRSSAPRRWLRPPRRRTWRTPTATRNSARRARRDRARPRTRRSPPG